MILRFLLNELVEIAARPLIWAGIIIASFVVLSGIEQLDLDTNRVKVLIIDSEDGQREGSRIEKLTREIEGVIPIVSASALSTAELMDKHDPAIVLSRAGNVWQATLRSRSILDHKRLARLGLMLATVINHESPWNAVISAEAFTPADARKMPCSVGARICSAYRWINHPKAQEWCSRIEGDPQSSSCSGNREVLTASLAYADAIGQFCLSDHIQAEYKRGLCPDPQKTSLLAVVGQAGQPQSHTRVFVPRTIALIVIFVSFVLGCRGIMNELRYGMLHVLMTADHGRLYNLLFAKLVAIAIFSFVVLLSLLVFAQVTYGMHIKPGLGSILLQFALGIASACILGMSVALLVKDEASIYLVGCVYLLCLFVLSGYIDDIRDGNIVVWGLSYLLPLKFLVSDFSSWVLFGRNVSSIFLVPLLAQLVATVVGIVLVCNRYRKLT
jgi:hypothetical protein